MDPVRFGRALGAGARAAARTVVQAADAAAAPNPRPAVPSRPADPRPTPAGPVQPEVLHRVPAQASSAIRGASSLHGARAASTARGLREGTRRFGREVWRPMVRLSGVLWLEFAGVFFGIFALFALIAAWRLRGAWYATPANGGEHQRLLGAIGMLVVFGYFCISSFVRASRRGRRF